MGSTSCLHPLLHLFLLLLPSVEVHSESSKNHTGKEFLVAFPEIIASYYPTTPRIRVHVAALARNARVTTVSNLDGEGDSKVTSEKTHTFTVAHNLELGRENISRRSLRISCNDSISVFTSSRKNSSMQTLLIAPTDTLGTKYFIPPVPSIQNTTSPASAVTMQVTERSPFRIIILNTSEKNKVTVTGTNSEQMELSSYSVAQVWLDQRKGFQAVEADKPVAVFFGHPCAVQKECTCGPLYTRLPPATEDASDFIIPPFDFMTNSRESAVLVSSRSGESSSRPYSRDSPVVAGASAAILYSPGLLLALTPASDFGSCYIVNTIPDTTSKVMIMVKKDETNGVRIGTDWVPNDWNAVENTDYKATSLELQQERNVIWHQYSKMAVYFIGDNDGHLFGHPAPVISTTPDFRGCVVTPETLQIGESALGWRESLQYCKEQNMKLITFSTKSHVEQVGRQLSLQELLHAVEVWISMRRSSLTGDWYWADKRRVNFTNWGRDEPGSVEEGQCAMMSLRAEEDFMWRDEDCCRRARPLCFTQGRFITE